MLSLASLMILIIFILTLMMTISLLISKKSFKDREKNSPFECGFDPKNSARLPFSIHFFLIALIFLIFDIEVVLIIPFIYTFKFSNIMMMTLNISLFITILVLGLYHEWNQGALNWKF